MRRRHTLLIGFGLGALTVIFAAAVANRGALLAPNNTARTSAASPSPTPQPGPTLIPSATGPGTRAGAVLVYDPENRGVILFGGSHTVPHADGTNEGVSTGDTWLWDGKAWRRFEVPGPPARSSAMATYDSKRHVVVLFGGGGPTGTGPALLLNDTWAWDGSTWTKQAGEPPAASGWTYLTYDSATRQIVGFVYFGLDNHEPAGYTLTWDGVQWTDRTNASQPSPRADAGIAYDEATGQVVLYGGSFDQPQPFSETWVRDGSTWSLWSPAAGA